MTNVAKYIKAKRKEFGLTQVDLSQKAGVGLLPELYKENHNACQQGSIFIELAYKSLLQ